jgi:hypothetical protein
LHHPHLHCVVPGGGIARGERRWISCRRQFLFPVKVLSRVFRGKFIAYPKTAFRDGKLGFHGELEYLGQKRKFIEWLNRAAGTDWVVYAKPPFGGPRQVLKYLARYTHRVAISNQRLIALEDGRVTFHWKNYARAGEPATMTLKAEEFTGAFCCMSCPNVLSKSDISAFWQPGTTREYRLYAANCWPRVRPYCRILLRRLGLQTSQKTTRPIAVHAAKSGA